MYPTAWVASHVVAVLSIQWLASLGGEITHTWLLFGIPLTLGAVQWAFLSRCVRWYGLFWLPASGCGWFIGIVIGSMAQDLLGATLETDAARMSVLYGVTALAYATLTVAALQLMPRRSDYHLRGKCSGVSEGGLACPLGRHSS
jgi:hypothetical protein